MSNVSNLFEKKQGFEKPFITGFSKALRLFLEFNFIKSISASSASPPLLEQAPSSQDDDDACRRRRRPGEHNQHN